ncbi:MAG TPA: (d)CMP kinase, partial [Acinetobacter sp.]|nr:(d)CMP kinase [Acinetobacter sp.]
MTVQIITIDGPSGSGKGTLAAKIAAHYQYHLLDSGALYRLLGLSLFQQGMLDQIESNLAQCIDVALNLDIVFKSVNNATLIYLNDVDVTQVIRTE